MRFGSTNTVTLNAAAPASSSTWTIPDVGTTGTFAALEGAQTFTGNKTFTGTITTVIAASRVVVTDSSQRLTDSVVTVTELGYVSGVTSAIQTQLNGKQATLTTNSLTAASPLALSAGVTVIGAGAALSIATAASGTSGVVSATTQTLTGIKTFETQLIGKGTATNDSASAGYIGEYIESVIGSTSMPASGTYGEVTSISLTAGDWDISAAVQFEANGATYSRVDLEALIGTATGDNITGATLGSTYFYIDHTSGDTSWAGYTIAIPGARKSISGTTTYYLKVYPGTYSAGTPKCRGRISARRVR